MLLRRALLITAACMAVGSGRLLAGTEEIETKLDIRNHSLHKLQLQIWSFGKPKENSISYKHHIGWDGEGKTFSIDPAFSDTLTFKFKIKDTNYGGQLGFTLARKDTPDKKVMFYFKPAQVGEGSGWWVCAPAGTLSNIRFSSISFKDGTTPELTIDEMGLNK